MKTMRGTKIVGLCLAASLLAGPSACVISKQDFQTLSNQVAQNKRETDAKLASMERELKEELLQMSDPMRTNQANTWAEVEKMRVELGALQGKLDSVNRMMDTGAVGKGLNLAAMSEQIKNIRLALETQLGLEIPEGGGAAAEVPAQAGQPAVSAPAAGGGQIVQAAPDKPAPAPAPADAAQAVYDKGVAAFKDRQYDTCVRYMDEFVATFPKNELVPNALFWKGEAYFQMGDFAHAILSYDDVINKYAKSSKYKAALLKQGICFYMMNNAKVGKIRLEDLIKRFPDSAEAVRAKALLKNPPK